jgi:hypothetical protein
MADNLRYYNTASSKMLGTIAANTKVFTDQQKADQIKKLGEQERLTKAMLNFEDVWGRVSGDLRAKVYEFSAKVIDGVIKGWDAFNANGGMQRMQAAFSAAGDAISRWMGKATGGDLGTVIANMTEGALNGFTSLLDNAIPFLRKTIAALEELWPTIKRVATEIWEWKGPIVAAAAGFMALNAAFGVMGLVGGGMGMFGTLAKGLGALAGVFEGGAVLAIGSGVAALAAGVGAAHMVKQAGSFDAGPIMEQADRLRRANEQLENRIAQLKMEQNANEFANNGEEIRRLEQKLMASKEEAARNAQLLDTVMANRQVDDLRGQRDNLINQINEARRINNSEQEQSLLKQLRASQEALNVASARAVNAEREATGQSAMAKELWAKLNDNRVSLAQPQTSGLASSEQVVIDSLRASINDLEQKASQTDGAQLQTNTALLNEIKALKSEISRQTDILASQQAELARRVKEGNDIARSNP